jgi:hypothetical protein
MGYNVGTGVSECLKTIEAANEGVLAVETTWVLQGFSTLRQTETRFQNCRLRFLHLLQGAPSKTAGVW